MNELDFLQLKLHKKESCCTFLYDPVARKTRETMESDEFLSKRENNTWNFHSHVWRELEKPYCYKRQNAY